MPGIVGVIGPQSPELCSSLVAQMVDAMRHHPAYVHGIVPVPASRACVGWVAHPHSMGARPLLSERGVGATLLLAGESWPLKSGARLMERGDCSSLFQGFEEFGDAFVGRLDGLFSGVLIDSARGRVVLFNDRYSGERLYLHTTKGVTYFASEAKAILRVVPELRAWDLDGVAQFLRFGCTLAGRTLFRNLQILPGGSLWTFENGEARPGRYFQPSQLERESALDIDRFEQQFCDLFPERLTKYLAADDVLGLSITGGLDTRMIMASLPAGGVDGICYTYAGRDGLTRDAVIGAEVAAMCGMEHKVLRIDDEFLRNYAEYADRTVHVTDGCAGPLHAHEIYLTRHAAALSKVRLTGNFGSEVLRGISTFKPIRLMDELLVPEMRSRVSNVTPQMSRHPVSRAVFEEIPWSLFGSLAAARSEVTVRTPYLDNALVKLVFQAPDGVRGSSTAERRLICERNPRLAAIATDRGCTPAARSAVLELPQRLFAAITFKLDYWHKEGLPRSSTAGNMVLDALATAGVLGQHKYLPYRTWFAKELREYMEAVLCDATALRCGFFNASAVRDVVVQHGQAANYLNEIHAVMLLEAVDRTLLSPRSRPQAAIAGAAH